ncbi:hypothetical protein AB751O23_AJ_00210 [Chlamydiales bacterium SCGC AB-751-O23]|nr:hypothetical protein AB751O23_AJ_00210 [Chlamydiales bacterium SCGC AB-751-O23]
MLQKTLKVKAREKKIMNLNPKKLIPPQTIKEEDFKSRSCRLIKNFFQKDFCSSPLNELSLLLKKEAGKSKVLKLRDHQNALEKTSLSLGKEVNILAIEALKNSPKPKEKVLIAIKKLILEKILDLFCLYSSYLPYHNFLHSVKVANDASLLAKNITWEINNLKFPLSSLEYLKGIFHDIRFYYKLRYKREAGTNLKTNSEGLSFQQFSEDLRRLELWIQENCSFTFRFTTKFIEEVKHSIFFTVPSILLKPFSVHNFGHFDSESSPEEFQEKTKVFLGKDREEFLGACFEKEVELLSEDPERIKSFYQKLPQILVAFVDVSSSITEPTKWVEEEIETLFIEEYSKAFNFIYQFHQKNESFPLATKRDKEIYQRHFESYKSWISFQLSFSQSRIATAYLRFYIPLIASIKYLKNLSSPSLTKSFQEESLKRFETLESNFRTLFCLEPSHGKFPTINDKAYESVRLKSLELNLPESSLNKTPWRTFKRLINLYHQRTGANFIASEKEFDGFMNLCSHLRSFP